MEKYFKDLKRGVALCYGVAGEARAHTGGLCAEMEVVEIVVGKKRISIDGAGTRHWPLRGVRSAASPGAEIDVIVGSVVPGVVEGVVSPAILVTVDPIVVVVHEITTDQGHR